MVEAKVNASSAAAAASGIVLWALGKYVFKGDVPPEVVSWTYVLVPAILAWVAGYFAPHTHRPDLEERNTQPPAPVVTGGQGPPAGG